MPTVNFYFDYRSPYSFLAHSELRRMAVELSYHPFDIRDLMAQVGNVPTTVTCKAKQRYARADLRRWAMRYGVPFQRHPNIAEIDFRRLLRATLVAHERGAAPQVISALFQAVWGSAESLNTASDVAAVLAGAGLDPEGLASIIEDPVWDQAVDRATAAAVERGVFGAPTMFVGDEMFFGNDRLEFVRAQLEDAS